MSPEEKNWIITLKRLAAISGKSVPELLNDYWECETDHVNSIQPFAGNQLDSELITATNTLINQEQILVKH